MKLNELAIKLIESLNLENNSTLEETESLVNFSLISLNSKIYYEPFNRKFLIKYIKNKYKNINKNINNSIIELKLSTIYDYNCLDSILNLWYLLKERKNDSKERSFINFPKNSVYHEKKIKKNFDKELIKNNYICYKNNLLNNEINLISDILNLFLNKEANWITLQENKIILKSNVLFPSYIMNYIESWEIYLLYWREINNFLNNFDDKNNIFYKKSLFFLKEIVNKLQKININSIKLLELELNEIKIDIYDLYYIMYTFKNYIKFNNLDETYLILSMLYNMNKYIKKKMYLSYFELYINYFFEDLKTLFNNEIILKYSFINKLDNKFYLKNNIPNFLNKLTIDNILEIVILKKMIKILDISIEHSMNKILINLENISNSNIILNKNHLMVLFKNIDNYNKDLNKLIINFLKENNKIYKHLKLFTDTIFYSNEIFFNTVFNEINKNYKDSSAKDILYYNIQNLIDKIINKLYNKESEKILFNSLKLKLIESSLNENIWDIFCLDFNFSSIISILINKNVRFQYLRISKFLFNFRIVYFNYKKLFYFKINIKKFKHPILNKIKSKIILLKKIIHYYLNSLWSYFYNQVFEINYKKLLNIIDNSNEINKIIAEFKHFFNNIINELFLNENQIDINNSIYFLNKLIEKSFIIFENIESYNLNNLKEEVIIEFLTKLNNDLNLEINYLKDGINKLLIEIENINPNSNLLYLLNFNNYFN